MSITYFLIFSSITLAKVCEKILKQQNFKERKVILTVLLTVSLLYYINFIAIHFKIFTYLQVHFYNNQNVVSFSCNNV